MKIIISILLLTIYNSVSAEGVITAVVLKESYSDSVEVSGKYLVGAQLQLKSQNKTKSLHVLFPQNTVGNLCVSLSSVDGRYSARIEYEIEDAVSGLTRVDFGTGYKDIFDKYSNEELAISATLMKPCDNYNKRKVLISSWGSDVTNNLVLLIRSSARKDMANILNAKTNGVKCKKFRDSKVNSISYDKSCVFMNVDTSELSGIKINRKNLQSIMPETVEFY